MYTTGVVFAAKLILYYFFVGNRFIVAAVSSIKSRAGSYSLGIFPSSMASLIADKISPTGRDGGNPNVIAGIEQESSYGRVGNDFFGEDDRSHVQSYEFLYVFHLLIEW